VDQSTTVGSTVRSSLLFTSSGSDSLADQDDGPQGSDQERRHVGGHAAGRRRLRHAGSREVQHREGHRRVHQEGVRQEVQPHLALHRRTQLWKLRDARDEALHLLLSRAGRHPAVQVRMSVGR